MREELRILRDIRQRITEARHYCHLFPQKRERMAVHIRRLVELADACVTLVLEDSNP